MSKYASTTETTPEKTIQEIRQTIVRFGATDFAFIMGSSAVAVNFSMKNRLVRFVVKLPPLSEFARTPERRIHRSSVEQQKAWDQATRQRYRALLLVIKAKLEGIESGIETFDEAFMAHLVLPNGETVGEWAKPQVEQIYSNGVMPPMLPSSIDR